MEDKVKKSTWLLLGVSSESKKIAKLKAKESKKSIGEWVENQILVNNSQGVKPSDIVDEMVEIKRAITIQTTLIYKLIGEIKPWWRKIV